jgi:hypothetical protein
LQQRQSLCAFKAGGVYEYQVEPREQVAPMREQPLLHHVLAAAGREWRALLLLLFRLFLAQPGHRPIEMMQIEPHDAGDRIVLAPAIAGARSQPLTNNRCSTVRNTASSRTKPRLRLPASYAITARQPVSSQSRSNTSGGPRSLYPSDYYWTI